MWDLLPLDVLSHIFSFLPANSIANAITTCKHWHTAALLHPNQAANHAPWLLAMPTRTNNSSSSSLTSCYAYNPSVHHWHSLPLNFIPFPIRLVAPLGSLLLLKLSNSPTLRLLLCNPFTRQYKLLPTLITPRSNPAIAVVINRALLKDILAGGPKINIKAQNHSRISNSCIKAQNSPGISNVGLSSTTTTSFRVYVAGGTRGASYEPTVESYDSTDGAWRNVGPMPYEFAVRLTVWTPNESVHDDNGVIYWVTSARAYSVVGFDVGKGVWREVKVPLADKLEWAALVKRRNGRVGLVGGGGDGEGTMWELGEGDEWVVVGVLAMDIMVRRSCYKCVGSCESVYLFRDLGSEMMVWRESDERRREWECSIDKWLPDCAAIKAVMFHPSLSPSSMPWSE